MKRHGSGKKRRWGTRGRATRAGRTSLPERKVFFCDCGAMWDSEDALGEHGRECESVIANGGYFERDDHLTATEEILKRLDPRMDLRVFLGAVAVSQLSRERGVPQPDGSSRFEADDEEMMAKIVEVGSWYGLSEQEVFAVPGVVTDLGVALVDVERLAAHRRRVRAGEEPGGRRSLRVQCMADVSPKVNQGKERSYRRGYQHGWLSGASGVRQMLRAGRTADEAYDACAEFGGGELSEGLETPPTFEGESEGRE